MAWAVTVPTLTVDRCCEQICDVRDCGEIQALIAESTNPRNGSRYNICATDDSGELNVFALQAKLMRLFPDLMIGVSCHDIAASGLHSCQDGSDIVAVRARRRTAR